MKYTPEITARLLSDYAAKIQVEEIARGLQVPTRSVIAKLSSLGVYKKKSYVTKRGEIPVKKAEYIQKLSELLKMHPDQLESLEKVNKVLLSHLQSELEELAKYRSDPKPQQLEYWVEDSQQKLLHDPV